MKTLLFLLPFTLLSMATFGIESQTMWLQV